MLRAASISPQQRIFRYAVHAAELATGMLPGQAMAMPAPLMPAHMRSSHTWPAHAQLPGVLEAAVLEGVYSNTPPLATLEAKAAPFIN